MYFFRIFFIYIFFIIPLCAEVNYQEIEDKCELKILTPSLSDRKTAKIKLHNGLKAYLISDPKADQSASALSVNTGSWENPKNYPGMAHFLEHMLFKGTKLYPEEEGFWQYIYDNGGAPNAFTSDDRTVYFFSINNDAFEEGLNRFSRFFIDPLFDPSGLERELYAVDQEYSKNIENDGWRKYQIIKEIGNPNHPNHEFSTGNSSTLKNIPREQMIQWFLEHYSSNLMTLVVYSKKPMDELKSIVASNFDSVVNLNISPLKVSSCISSKDQYGNIIYIKPIKNLKNISLLWELPKSFNKYNKLYELIAYSLTRGQENNLLEFLKKKKYAEDLSAESYTMGNNHSFFSINIDLTPNGINNIEKVISYCFESLNVMKEEKIPKYLLDEQKTMARINYEYQDHSDAMEFVMNHANKLIDEDFKTYPQKTILIDDYKPQVIEDLLNELTPQNCQYYLMADPKYTNVILDRKEKWLGGEYAIKNIEKDVLDSWSNIKSNHSIEIAPPNPFLPSNLDLVPISNIDLIPTSIDIGTLNSPLLLNEKDMGKVFYAKDNLFLRPQSIYLYNIKSPLINGTALSSALLELYQKFIYQKASPITSSAYDAGISSSLFISPFSLELYINGYSEKCPLLLKDLIQICKTNRPTEDEFLLLKKSLEQDYENNQKNLPIMQAFELMSSLICPTNTTNKEKLSALSSVEYLNFINFSSHLFDKTYVESCLTGNFTIEQAETVWDDFISSLNSQPFTANEQYKNLILCDLYKQGPCKIVEKTNSMGTGIILVIEQGSFDYKKRSAQKILSKTLSEAFFTSLRSKQKTAYIAQSWDQNVENELFQFFAVQSSSHNANDLINRFELFFKDFSEKIKEYIPESRFENIRNTLLTKIKREPKNLSEATQWLNHIAFDKKISFSHSDQIITAFEKLTYEEFIILSSQWLSQENKGRLAVISEGKLLKENPFSNEDSVLNYEKITKKELLKNGNYKTPYNVRE
jgi:insulysin